MSDDWIMGATAAQDAYRPLGNDPWTNTIKPPAKDLPDVGPPLIPSGPTWEGSPRANRAADIASTLANDMLVPQTPLDWGLTLATGGVGKLMSAPYKIGTIAASHMLTADPAEAGAGKLLTRARDPRLWSPISDQKLKKPLDEMEHAYTDVRTPMPKIVDPASLVGGYGIFTPYDLSTANRTLTHVDATKLPTPVRAYGGVGFSEANPGFAAASEAPIARRLDNQAAALTEKTGKPVYIMPMTMSEQGIDASHHVADPLAQMTQMAKIKKDDAAAFNEMMRKSVPGWTDIESGQFPDYIRNLQGGMTTKALMADRMALARWQAKGFPDVAAIRHAMTVPELIGLPRDTTGMAISRYTPGQGLLESPHPSYSKGVAGEYMGQLASLIPFEVAAPDIAKGLAAKNAANLATGKTQPIFPAYHMKKPTPGVPTAQEFDAEWLDNVMKHWEAKQR